MAQSITTHIAPSIGNMDRFKLAVITIVNTAAETTFTLTPAQVGMNGFAAVMAADEVAAAAVRVSPTRVAGLITSAALTFTAGDEVTLLCIGQ